MSGYVTTGNYEVVEYLEASETQYFDTGFTPNQDTGVKCKFKMLTNDNSNSHLFGSGYSYYQNTFECYLWNQQIEFNYNQGYTFAGDVHIGDTLEIDWNKNIIKYRINDGAWNTITMSYGNFTTPGSMWVFLNNRTQGSTPVSSKSQLIYFEVYDNGELVRSYKPAQSLDGTSVGLYDTVNDTFITNSGTGEIISGEPTGEFVDTKTSTRLKVNASKDITQLDYDLAECEEGWFSKYTRVEYITQNGTGARIDTGIQFKDIGYMDLDFQYDVANFTCVCGGATGGGNNYVCWYSNQLHEGRGGNVIDSGNDRIIGHRYRFISKQGTNTSIAYRDGEFLKNYTSYLFSNSTAIMGLFAFGGGGYSGGTQRIYYAEFRRSENGEVLRKFIPCIRKSDSKSGMYDMVTKQFFEGIGETFYPSSKEYHFDYQKYHMYCARPIYQIDIDIADKIDGWFGEYIRCDYIENQSQARIDTGFSAPNGFKSQMGLYFYEIGDTGSRTLPIIGAHEPSSPYGRNDMIIRPYFEMGAGDVYITDYYVQPDTYYEIDFSNVKGDLYVVDHTLTRSYGGDDSRSSRNLYLFDVNGYNFANKLKFRMYYCKIYNDNNELVRDYIPCIRRSDLKAGLYDLVTCEFYTSNSGYDFIPGGRQYEFNFIKY